ncbi:hypothetical protein K2173_022158 [Erythroxylum novogranatense]|uniref:Protein Iojap, chloroplastic n=1 Tax=Erythroxylum novogranatense TaxID=1862640 RepID=A0AAV8SUQ3_9ROSI|nr:hypothetical protein K2173_022158 [Erythroxylum novogranatense]
MAMPTTLSIGGTRFGGELQQLGHIEPKLSRRPGNCFGGLCRSRIQSFDCKYVCQIPRRMNLNFNPSFAIRKDADDNFLSNVENTDDIFDDLFNKYGKVVFRRSDGKPPSAEVDDDSESLSFAVAMAKVASEVKAADIKILFVKPLVYWTRFFIIATAFSRPQIDAIRSKIRDLAEEKYGKVSSGDTKPNSWTLLDFGDVVIHIFLPQQRAFYNLEEFYGNATPIEVSFEKQPPFHG